MITQLQNQDPLSPAKNEDFIAQLAQFSSVEGIQNINNSIDDLASSFRSSQALEASTLVGRQVEVSTSQAQLTSSGSVKGTISLPSSADNVRLVIEDASGNTVRTIVLAVSSEVTLASLGMEKITAVKIWPKVSTPLKPMACLMVRINLWHWRLALT